MATSFESVEQFQGCEGHEPFQALLEGYTSPRILEIGSGANPTLTSGYVRDHHLSYVTSDIDPDELDKADNAFETLLLDPSQSAISPTLIGAFDFIMSRMVGEHIKDGHQYHENIYKMLRPGGLAVHCFSTLWAAPFAANRLLPEWVADIMLGAFNPRDRHQHGKFKAYYSWSRGPSKGMVGRFEGLGYEVVRYTGYFGHPYYRRVPFLDWIERAKMRLLVQHPIPQLCSYATIVLRKPLDGA